MIQKPTSSPVGAVNMNINQQRYTSSVANMAGDVLLNVLSFELDIRVRQCALKLQGKPS